MNKEEIDLLEIVFTLAIGECAYNDITYKNQNIKLKQLIIYVKSKKKNKENILKM